MRNSYTVLGQTIFVEEHDDVWVAYNNNNIVLGYWLQAEGDEVRAGVVAEDSNKIYVATRKVAYDEVDDYLNSIVDSKFIAETFACDFLTVEQKKKWEEYCNSTDSDVSIWMDWDDEAIKEIAEKQTIDTLERIVRAYNS